ncbi:vWA domain-containing protein [Nonomuraea soli]|uniref:Ca-activated chloride channel family protein n=1 Tax=Nonomuraea soli TaxID=1032476 RepID=A0A7W0CTJ4_9ACTN|nr:von Willebrand factor type A domain-containing protein [Nonomuraea soli]MBA2896870.1 Ca-activated chloride channel family protein [Nonomuraea soli]
MKSRRVVAVVGLVALLGLSAACGGGATSHGPEGSQSDAAARAPQQESEAQARPTAAAPEKKSQEQDTEVSQISTFALDVDTASYDYARRTLGAGTWPAPDQIRPEEFVNAFRQDYAEPRDNGFTVHVDGAMIPGRTNEGLVRVGLQTRRSDAAARRPANLTFVVDVSGSMAETGRLDLVQSALRTLLGQLGAGDQVAIVSFSTDAQVVADMTPLVSRDALLAAVDALAISGGTNVAAGLTKGYEIAARGFRPAATNRVILLSDGLANAGDTTWQGILDRVSEHAGRQITLLTVGVGREYGDELMEQLADNGDGHAIYVSTVEEAEQAFVKNLPATIELRARDAKAQVVFNQSVVESYELIGYENRQLATEEFRDDSKDGGEVGPGHAVTALYAVKLVPGASGQLAAATVRWQDPDTRTPAESSKALEAADLHESLWAKAPLRLQVDAVVAAFALYMRDRQAFGMDLGSLSEQAARLAAEAEDPQLAELAQLVEQARKLG